MYPQMKIDDCRTCASGDTELNANSN